MEHCIPAAETPPFTSAPVFVAGDNRSGTTLLSILLDSHPDLVIGPELDFKQPSDLGPQIIECCRLLIEGDPRVCRPGVEAQAPFRYNAQFSKQCHRFGVEHELLEQLASRAMKCVGSDLVDFEERCVLINLIGETQRRRHDVGRWGLKIQRDLLEQESYRRLWPHAHFVHIVRDGRDVAASHLRSSRRLYYTRLEDAARGWAELMCQTRKLVGRREYFELRYEDLVEDPSRLMKKVVNAIGLDWDDSILDHASRPHALFENPYLHPSVEAVRQPINPSSIGRFRTDLTAQERSRFEEIAGVWLERMGYPV